MKNLFSFALLALFAGLVSAADELYVVDHAVYMPTNTTANFTTNLGNWTQNYTISFFLNYTGASTKSWWVAVDINMPHGFHPHNNGNCNGSAGFRVVNFSRDPYGKADFNSRVACQINITAWPGNLTNVTLVISANNITALSDKNSTTPIYFWANLSSNMSAQGAGNTTFNSTNAARYMTTHYVNPRPYASTLSAEFSTNATLWVTNWNQTRATYSLNTPVQSWNDTSKRPEYRNGSLGELMYMPGSMIERPTYMELWSYNFTFSLRNLLSNNSVLFQICSPVNNTATSAQNLLPLLIRNETMYDFFDNSSFNMTIGVPSQDGFSVWIDGTQYTSTTAAAIGLNMLFSLDDQSLCGNGPEGLFTVNVTNATTANNTFITVLLTLGNSTGGSSPIYVNWQNLGGFSMQEPPAFGQNVTYSYTAYLTNPLSNYTLSNVALDFFLPENVTPFESGSPNTTVFNITGNMSMYWNDTAVVGGNWTYAGITTRSNCTNQTDKMPGSPMQNVIIQICMREYSVQFASATFGSWNPNSSNSNITVKLNATMSFPSLEEVNNTPGQQGTSNYYNASFSTSVETALNLTEKVPGIASAGCANTVVKVDGQTFTCGTNYTIGSLTLNDVAAGSHSVSVSYSIPSSGGGGGGGGGSSSPTPTASPNPSPTPTATPTPTPTPTASPSPNPTPTPSPSPSGPPAPLQEQSNTALQADDAINDAVNKIREAKASGVDVTQAENWLEQAVQARELGNYGTALEYALKARNAIRIKTGAGFDASLMVLAAIGMLAVGAAYYLLRKRNAA